MPPDYARPDTLPEALALLAQSRRQALAGGTDVYPAVTGKHICRPVLDLSAIPDLRGIRRHAAGMRLGAMVTWAEVAGAGSPGAGVEGAEAEAAALPPACDALRQAAVQVGGRQIQNAGTIGGNLCNASPAADGVPPLLVLGAEVELASLRGTRRLPLAAFLTGPRRTALAPDELLVAVHLPDAGLAGASRFLKLGARAYLVISIAMVAVRLVVVRGMVTEAALAVGACSAVAVRLPLVEAALPGAPLAQAAARIGDAAVAAALTPLDDLRATAAYRAGAAAELLRRAVDDLAKEAAA
ncbi:FAD binding domain-containing protein [Paracoccaceae bacterium Fryx2]|nr:FAD binding domain-containing protein [Paracoccaceae bacterium Fryx2]